MTATVAQARDEIQATFRIAWLADSGTQDYFVKYEDVAQGDTPEKTSSRPLPWARLTIRHNPGAGGQVALGTSEDGRRRYRRFGVATVGLFAPKGDGFTTLDAMTLVAMRAFEGVRTDPGQITFSNIRPAEIGTDGDYTQVNVLVDFEYDEVR